MFPLGRLEKIKETYMILLTNQQHKSVPHNSLFLSLVVAGVSAWRRGLSSGALPPDAWGRHSGAVGPPEVFSAAPCDCAFRVVGGNWIRIRVCISTNPWAVANFLSTSEAHAPRKLPATKA